MCGCLLWYRCSNLCLWCPSGNCILHSQKLDHRCHVISLAISEIIFLTYIFNYAVLGESLFTKGNHVMSCFNIIWKSKDSNSRVNFPVILNRCILPVVLHNFIGMWYWACDMNIAIKPISPQFLLVFISFLGTPKMASSVRPVYNWLPMWAII